MDIPTHLSHKPIIKLENYSDIDAIGLSIGLAQWCSEEQIDFSAKIWRYTGERWSRQSEEMPIHRVLDLASLICSALFYSKNKALSEEDKIWGVTSTTNPDFLSKIISNVNLEQPDIRESIERLALSLKRLDV